MARGDAFPDGPAGLSSRAVVSFETNRVFAPDVLDIEDLWQWESIGSSVSKTKPFALDGLDAAASERPRGSSCSSRAAPTPSPSWTTTSKYS